MPQRKKPRVTSSLTRSKRAASSKAKTTSDASRGPSPGRFGQNKQRPGSLAKAGGSGRVTGTAGRPKPKTPAKVTTGRGRTSPKLPKVPAKSKPSYKGKGATKPSAAKLAKQVAARKAARVAARTAARGAGAVGKGLLRAGAKLAGRAVLPLAMVQEVRTMAARQRRYNAQAAARRKKK